MSNNIDGQCLEKLERTGCGVWGHGNESLLVVGSKQLALTIVLEHTEHLHRGISIKSSRS